MATELLPVNEADAEELVALRIAAMRESLEHVGRFDAQRARERFLHTFTPQHTRHIVHDGKRVGFVAVKPDGDGLVLDHRYIHAEYQGLGIGTCVLHRVFVEADDQLCNVRVGALKGSLSNCFYVRHGFELVEEAEWDNYYVRKTKGRLDSEC